jgi:hypothetical protein
MDSDHGYPVARVRLPGHDGPGPARPRREGIRHARRVSNWTAAVLIAGTGAAAVAFAHQAFPGGGTAAAGANVSGTGRAGSGTTGTGTGAAATTGGPQVAHSVATTTASGVTVTTTTQTVNGKAVVTQARSAPAGGDN